MAESQTFRVSKTINAPLKFVYDWCTDYREDDNKIVGSDTETSIVQRTKRRVLYITSEKDGDKRINSVNIVTLKPPNGWHLDFAGPIADEDVDYRLTQLAPKRTRLVLKVRVNYKIPAPPTQEEGQTGTSQKWDKFVTALERDYAKSNP